MLKSGDLHGVQEKEFAQEIKKKQSLHKSGVQFENTDIEAVPSKLSVPLPFFIQHFQSAEQIAKDSVCVMCSKKKIFNFIETFPPRHQYMIMIQCKECRKRF